MPSPLAAFRADRSRPAVDARMALRARNRSRIERLSTARRCAHELLADYSEVTAERLDRFAERLLEMAEAQSAEAATEFIVEASALAQSLAAATPPEQPDRR